MSGLLALWIFTHPYWGICHDARLYAVQALSHLFPENYGNDLFFLYGSQDSYTIFSQIYAFAIDLLGLNAATIALQIAGHILWLSAAFLLGRSLLRDTPAFWSFLIFAGVLPRGYGNGLFSYDELFLTARIFSEAMVLYGIAFLVNRKDGLAFLFLLLAALFHPLMAAGGMVFTYFFKAYTNRRWLYFLIAVVLLGYLAAYWQIRPFTGLFETMDEEWYQFSHTISAHVFPDTWEPEHLNAILFDACVIGSAFLVASGVLRAFFFSSLITGFAGTVLSSIGTYLFRNVFIIQLQPWRALWLMHLFAYLAGAFLLFELWGRSRFSRLLLTAYLAVWFMVALVPFSGILALLIFFTHYLMYDNNRAEPRVPWLVEKGLLLTTVTAGTAWTFYWILFAYVMFLETPDSMGPLRFTQEILLDTKIFLVFGFMSLRNLIAGTEQRKTLMVSLAVSVLCIMGAMGLWDHRTQREKFIEVNALEEKIFGYEIPAGSVVSWPDYYLNESTIKKIWFMLGASSYADPLQTVGTIFSREMSIKYFQRSKKLEYLGFVDCWHREENENVTVPKPALRDFMQVCRDPELDYVVLNFKYPYGVVDSYRDEYSKKKYYLYDCKAIRRISEIQLRQTPEYGHGELYCQN